MPAENRTGFPPETIDSKNCHTGVTSSILANDRGGKRMRKSALAAASAIALSACAGSQPGMIVEQGYQRGALGVAAIDRGDWAAAEAQLSEARGARSDDPARLINLGRVYAE